MPHVSADFANGFAAGVFLCALAWAAPRVVALWQLRTREDEQARLQRERFARGQKWETSARRPQ